MEMTMKKMFFLLALFLTACGTVETEVPSAVRAQVTPQPMRTATPSPNAVQTAMAIIEIDRATSTAAAAATSTSYAVTSTREAKETAAFWVGVTMAVSTERAGTSVAETRIAKTEIAGTQQAGWNLTQTPLAATQIAFDDKVKSDKVSRWVFSVGGSVFAVAFLWLVAFMIYKAIPIAEDYANAKVLQKKTDALKPDEQGRFPIVPTGTLKAGEKFINPNLSHRAYMDSNAVDDLTTEEALGNTDSQRKLEAIRSVSNSPILRRVAYNMVKNLSEGQKQAAADEDAAGATFVDDLNLPLPPWEFILKWDGTSKPLGFGRQGLITAKAASPHILVAGKSGSGKTRYMLRPLTAASLVKGEVVVNLGYSEIGFGVFDGHPNYYSARLRKPTDIVECLARVYDELRDRKHLIGGMDTEWEHWQGGKPPRPFVTLLMDELENLSEDIYNDYDNGSVICREMWSYITRIAKEGRKTGIVFQAALQDGTSKSIDLRFRRNCTLVAFQLGDQSHSNSFIGASGADALSVGHFMARTDGVVIGGGFEPTDEEIGAYLSRHRSAPADKPKWIDGVVHPLIEPTDGDSLPAVKAVDDELTDTEKERILKLHSEGKSASAIVADIWGVRSGKPWYDKKGYVEGVINKRTSSTSPFMPPQTDLPQAI